jgi:hypothetical protein
MSQVQVICINIRRLGLRNLGNLEVMRFLVSDLGAKADEVNDSEGLPRRYVFAALIDYLASVQYLVAKLGAGVNHASEDGATPRYAEAYMGRFVSCSAMPGDR